MLYIFEIPKIIYPKKIKEEKKNTQRTPIQITFNKLRLKKKIFEHFEKFIKKMTFFAEIYLNILHQIKHRI